MPQRPVSRSRPARSTPAATLPSRRRSLPRFEAPRRIEGPGFSALFGPAPPVYDPGGPVPLADHVADGTDAASLEAEAIRVGAVLLIVPAVPGPARPESCPDPAGMWRRTGRPVGPSLIVAE
jgi:hypothetical protein